MKAHLIRELTVCDPQILRKPSAIPRRVLGGTPGRCPTRGVSSPGLDDVVGMDLSPRDRIARAAEAAAKAGLDALLLTPGPDLRYLTGYDTHASERLTCLAVPASGG